MLRLSYAALSDVGRVRKDNQDSGYAGPHVLTVCDGVGGAARGDIASSAAVGALRRLDDEPLGTVEDTEALLGVVSHALHRAHDRIADLVDEDPALNGTSTTATVGLFDGERLAMGHVGDSRAYLLREGTIRQLTKDHTFVQTLIDEGRITDAEARVHPHRNLILQAIDGMHDLEPDLFVVDLQEGDRLLFCSDGASGVLDDTRMTQLLGIGSPALAAVELLQASLDAGSTDNVTCVVADVLDAATPVDPDVEPTTGPQLVGAASELRRRPTRSQAGQARGLFGRRADTGELEPVLADLPEDLPEGVDHAITSDPIDPEAARYAPRAPRRFLGVRRLMVAAIVVGLVWTAGAAAWSWSQAQYYVGEQDGTVVIFRGVDASVPGVSLSTPYETTNVTLDRLSDFDAGQVTAGIAASDLAGARSTVENLAARMSAEAG